ncbi:Cyclin-dependent kinase [Bertholletia excelsa]
MAAGRHGGYRDNEFRDRESDLKLSRRGFLYSKGEYHRIRRSDRDYGRGGLGEGRMGDRIRVRQKDIKERDVINGEFRSFSSKTDSGSSGGGGPWQCGFSVRAMDRESGELSSESGSDEAIDSESQIKQNKDSKFENGSQSPVETKKRKFSPIVWDRDTSEVNHTSNGRLASATATLPPPPPLPMSYRQLPTDVPDGGIQISPVEDNNMQLSESLPAKPHLEPGPHMSAVSESQEGLPSYPQEQKRPSFEETEHVEVETGFPTRNISASRWAGDANSPADEGEISDDEEMPRRRMKKTLLESVEMKARSKSITPEPGELKREVSEGSRAKSSDSDGGDFCVRIFSRDDYLADESNRNVYKEIDEESDKNGTNIIHSDTDSGDEDDHLDTFEPVSPPQRTVNMLQGCRSVDEFEKLNKIDEGTYGVVYRAKDKKTGEIVALKKVKMEKEREGFPLTSLREINILLSLHHPSIVDVKEVVVGSNLDSIFMVMEYMEHDLKGLMETMKQPFSQSEVKCLMLQLLEGIKYLHDNWVLHRDLKTSNLLLNNRGELKICDFGLARQYGSPLKPYTHLVVTLWYRAPELLLGAKQYSTAIDMWSMGCIMAELLSKEPLFNGKTEFDQLDKIFRILGTPNENIWPGFSRLPGVKVNFIKHQYNILRKKFPATSFTGSPVLSDAGFDLLNKLLTYDPEKRITAEDALRHEWFWEVPLPKSKEFMPTFPAQHAQDRRLRRIMKSPDPLQEQRRKELQQGEVGSGGLFG